MNKIVFIVIINFFISNLFADNKIINFDLINNQEKQTIVFLHMNNCGYCNRMKQITLQDEKIKKTIKESFSFVSINIDESDSIHFNNKIYKNRDFAYSLEVSFFPTILFLDSENEVIYTARGFRSIEKLQHILNFMRTNAFEDMSFFEYLEKSKRR